MNINISDGMNNKFKIIFLVLILLMMIIPHFVSAEWGGLVTCGTSKTPATCDFNALMAMVNKIISFIFIDLAIPICVLMFAYAGFLMVSAGGESASAKTKAKEIFLNTVIGLLFIAASWLIIHVILYYLGYDGSWIGF